MKRVFIAVFYLPVFLLISSISCTSPQNEPSSNRAIEEPMTELAEVDRLPAFKPCENVETENEDFLCFQKHLMQHLADNLNYPLEAQAVGLQGQMVTQFIIDRHGRTQEVKITKEQFNKPEEKAAVKAARASALQVIKTIPQLQPAMEQGAPVAVQFTLPIALQPE